ncbi:hypothetical protein CXG50_23575 [Pseudomonas plecoglossicida]|nr:hypothetical protein CX682_07565 [Pseudomonas sp. FFUP_PS_41]PLU94363.1 hypothetical protein CXG52_22790 [Pseudomonas plecoglossicida]PLV04421.1 hypothetical protein CXG50_23575 [Pseudomonas plecoglossicida]
MVRRGSVGAALCCEEASTDKACLLLVPASSQHKAAPTKHASDERYLFFAISHIYSANSKPAQYLSKRARPRNRQRVRCSNRASLRRGRCMKPRSSGRSALFGIRSRTGR